MVLWDFKLDAPCFELIFRKFPIKQACFDRCHPVVLDLFHFTYRTFDVLDRRMPKGFYNYTSSQCCWGLPGQHTKLVDDRVLHPPDMLNLEMSELSNLFSHQIKVLFKVVSFSLVRLMDLIDNNLRIRVSQEYLGLESRSDVQSY